MSLNVTRNSTSPNPVAQRPAATAPVSGGQLPRIDSKPRPAPSVGNFSCPLPRDYGLTPQEAAFLQLDLSPGTPGGQPGIVSRAQTTSADPAQDGSSAGWLQQMTNGFLARLRPNVWASAESVPVPAESSCPVDDPNCDQTQTVHTSSTGLPRPYSVLTTFLEDVNKDVFTVSMPHHLQDRQARMRLDQVHVLLVVREAGGVGLVEAERLLRQHFKWDGSTRPDLQVSFFSSFARAIDDLEPGQLWPKDSVRQLQQDQAKFDAFVGELEQFARSRNLLRPNEDLRGLTAPQITEGFLEPWGHQYRKNQQVLAEINDKAHRFGSLMGNLQMNRVIMAMNAVPHMLEKLQSMSEGRPKISVLGDNDYRPLAAKLKDMGRIVLLKEKVG